MWECEYSKEPMDYRLFGLQLLRKWWVIVAAVLAGIFVIGGGYYCSKMVLGNGRTYQTETICYLNFAQDASGKEYDFINHYTWNELIHTDFFTEDVTAQTGSLLTKEAVIASTQATVESDVRYLYIRVTTQDQELSMKIAGILEEKIVEFGEKQKEFTSIEVVKKACEAKDNSNIRTKNACILGGVIGFFAALFGLMALSAADTSVYLPATLEKRYHCVTLGAPCMEEFSQNRDTLLKEASTIALVPADESMTICADTLFPGKKVSVFEHFTKADSYEDIRSCDAVVLCVKAAAHNGRRLERTLEQLSRQNIKVSATLLLEENPGLIRAYYRK